MRRNSVKFDTQCRYKFENSVVPRFGTWAKGFIKALTPKSRIFGKLSHASSPGDISNSHEEYVRIRIFEGDGEVLRNDLFIVEVVGDIKGCKLSHGLLLGNGLEQGFGVLDISRLSGFVTTDKEQVDNLSSPRVIDPVAWTKVDAHFRDTAAQGLGVTKIAFGCPVKAIEDDGFGPGILQPSKPGAEFVGLEESVHGLKCIPTDTLVKWHSFSGLTNRANRPRLHRGDERSRGSREMRESGRQCRRGPT